MATARVFVPPHPSPGDANFVSVFVYDVLMYTLKACGYPTDRILATYVGVNVYNRPNFARIAGVTVLLKCLDMRNEIKKRLRRLPRNSCYDMNYFGRAFAEIVKSATTEEHLQLNVEISIATCNEMFLFFTSENIPFSFPDMLSATVSNIFCLIYHPTKWAANPYGAVPDFKEEIQKLFPDDINNIFEFSAWIEDFTKRYAVPYGSNKNVTDDLYREAVKRWHETAKSESHGGPSLEMVRERLGFLPEKVYDRIATESSARLPPYSEVAWGKRKSSESSAKSAVKGKKSCKKRSTGSNITPKQTAQDVQSSKDSSKISAKGSQTSKDSSELEIEDDFRRMSVDDAGRSQESKGAIPKKGKK